MFLNYGESASCAQKGRFFLVEWHGVDHDTCFSGIWAIRKASALVDRYIAHSMVVNRTIFHLKRALTSDKTHSSKWRHRSCGLKAVYFENNQTLKVDRRLESSKKRTGATAKKQGIYKCGRWQYALAFYMKYIDEVLPWWYCSF